MMKKVIVLASYCLWIVDSAAAPIWGRLANEGFENQPVKSVFFLAGNWRNGVKFYETNPSSNISLYTVHPSDARHLGWSESRANREFAVDAMVDAGINLVNMSTWGQRGTNNWAYWSPMQTSTYAHDELFDAAAGRDILVAPYIESTAATPRSPGYSFMDCFPGDPGDPAPAFVAQIIDLVERIILHPKQAAWPQKWAQLYDRSGNRRYAVSVIHAASNQQGVTDRSFAEGFDRVAEKVHRETGILVGFLLDALPPGTFAGGAFKPSASGTGPWLSLQESVLAIQCFIPEIWTGYANDRDLVRWKRGFSADWGRSGVPFILDLTPGYDAHVVFPGSMVYGNNPAWRDSLSRLAAESDCAGITFNSWNGFTEGMAFMPTLQYRDAGFLWARELFRAFDRQTGTREKPSLSPHSPVLSQNFPNPFNPFTTIPFSVPTAGRVTVKVFDLLGKEMAVLADGPFVAGNHTIQFDASGLASGVYMVRMETGGYSASRKMAVVK